MKLLCCVRGMLFVSIALPGLACNSGLSRDEALRSVKTHTTIRATDEISIDGISQGAPSEAIVRATLLGHTTNLKFRRFDSGWTWEFVETKVGGWIPPEAAMVELREPDRKKRAAAWAEAHRSEYERTAWALNILAIYVPGGRPDLVPFTVQQWFYARHRTAQFFDHRPDMTDGVQRAALMRNDSATDAWGSEFLVNFAAAERSATLVSAGPDKSKNTDDDLVCVTMAQSLIEDGELRWGKTYSWTLPEGLGAVVVPYTDKPGAIRFTKVVRP
jgi:hypothetical protein